MSSIISFKSDLDSWFQENREHGEAYARILKCYEEQSDRLDLKDLNLSTIPECIVQCTALKTLILSRNRLTSLPNLNQCENLQNLSVESNQLDDLSNLSIRTLRNLRVRDNPLTKPLPPGLKQINVDLFEGRQSYDQGAPFIPLYDMVQDLGIQKPNVLRITHDSAPKFGPKITDLLKGLGATVKEADADFPGIDADTLEREVQAAIFGADSASSIPEEILKKAAPDSQIGRIREHAKTLLQNCRGLALPGGLDVEAEFYEPNATIDGARDYRRSMAEFALIAAAKEMNIPIIGTCRGAQMLNVYGGGTLESLEEWQEGWKDLRLEDPALAARFGRHSFKTYSRHHQACSSIAPGFKVVMKDSGVPKLLIGDGGRMIATQVHPEADSRGFYSGIVRIYELFFQKTQECTG